jgi:hypothetical protein
MKRRIKKILLSGDFLFFVNFKVVISWWFFFSKCKCPDIKCCHTGVKGCHELSQPCKKIKKAIYSISKMLKNEGTVLGI